MTTTPTTSPNHAEISAQLDGLAALGVRVSPTTRGTLRVRGADLASPAALQWLRDHKAAILAHFTARASHTEIHTEDRVEPEEYRRMIHRRSLYPPEPHPPWVYADCQCEVDPARPDECQHTRERRDRRREGILARVTLGGSHRSPALAKLTSARTEFGRWRASLQCGAGDGDPQRRVI